MLTVSSSGTFQLGGDLTIYRLGFGAMRVTGPGIWGLPKNKQEAIDLIRKAAELDINFIDTADAYGPEISEILIAEALHPYPKGLVIATKGGLTRPGRERWEPNGRPDYLMNCVDKSLKRLKLDRIDLYQLHAVDPKVPIEESVGALKEMQTKGKIRHIGLSNVNVDEIKKGEKIATIVSVQNHYNFNDRKSESVLKYCEEKGMAFIPWYPLASGNFDSLGREMKQIAEAKGFTISQIALAWLLKHSAAMVPIPGTSKISHLEENAAAASIHLSEQELKD